MLHSLSLSVHTFQGELATSSHQDTEHQSLAESLRHEVVELFGQWDLCHHQTAEAMTKVEDGLQHLAQVERELSELQAELRMQKTTLLWKGEHSSEDSGWASEDYNLPGKQKRLCRLRQMAQSLQEVLSPRSHSAQAVARSLEATTSQLGDLKRTWVSLRSKARGRKGVGRVTLEGRRQDREQCRSRSVSAGRRRRVGRFCLGIHVFFLGMLFLSWLCQPSCCDTLSAISTFSPQLQYVNGPPPI